MSAVITLVCEWFSDAAPKGQKSCWARFEPSPDLGFPGLAGVRRAAREAGWMQAREYHRRLSDFCPAHAPYGGTR